jgi:hypothetical protein
MDTHQPLNRQSKVYAASLGLQLVLVMAGARVPSYLLSFTCTP